MSTKSWEKISDENKIYTLENNKVVVKEGAEIRSNDDGTLTIRSENEGDKSILITCSLKSGGECARNGGHGKMIKTGPSEVICGCANSPDSGCVLIVEDF